MGWSTTSAAASLKPMKLNTILTTKTPIANTVWRITKTNRAIRTPGGFKLYVIGACSTVTNPDVGTWLTFSSGCVPKVGFECNMDFFNFQDYIYYTMITDYVFPLTSNFNTQTTHNRMDQFLPNTYTLSECYSIHFSFFVVHF